MNAKKIDSNQTEIVSWLRGIGALVYSTASLGKGFPDIVCGYRGEIYLFEIKTPEGKLTRDEVKFHEQWFGYVHVVRSISEVKNVIGVK